MRTASLPRARKRWPLVLLAAPAAVAIWSGWVALGQMCGFGLVHPLPGIADQFSLNTAITLPIGVEAYSSYALGTWLSSEPISARARRFAAYSALGGLLLGLIGQVVYHVLQALGYTSAPISIVMFVSSLPVLALGAGATLHHLTAGHPAPDLHGEAGGEVATAGDARAVAALGAPAWEGAWLTTSVAPTDADPAEVSSPATGGNGADTGSSDAAIPDTTATIAADDRTEDVRDEDWSELLKASHEIAAELKADGVALSRRALTARLRARGRSCSTERAGEVVRQLRAEGKDHIGRLEAVS